MKDDQKTAAQPKAKPNAGADHRSKLSDVNGKQGGPDKNKVTPDRDRETPDKNKVTPSMGDKQNDKRNKDTQDNEKSDRSNSPRKEKQPDHKNQR